MGKTHKDIKKVEGGSKFGNIEGMRSAGCLDDRSEARAAHVKLPDIEILIGVNHLVDLPRGEALRSTALHHVGEAGGATAGREQFANHLVDEILVRRRAVGADKRFPPGVCQ